MIARVMRILAVVLLVGCGRIGFEAGQSAGGDDAAATDGMNTGDAAVPLVCVNQTCDLWPQCGCDPGSKCDVDLSGARACTAAGTRAHGDTCTSSVECQSGTTCLRMSDWPASRCMQFCDVHSDCDALGNGALCALAASSGGMLLYRACTIACSVIAQTGCPAQTQCSIYNFGAIAGANCTGIGAGALNASCSVHSDCGPGMLCAGTCKTACIVGDSSPCTGPTTCVGTGLVSDGVEFGMCL